MQIGWVLTALAASPLETVEFVVEGEVLVRRHGDEYCSWSALQGITTKVRPLPEPTEFDPVFRLDKSFTGLVVTTAEGAVGAVGLEIPKSLSEPTSGSLSFYQVFRACRVDTLEANSVAELARKGSPGARAAIVRALLGMGLVTTKCGETNRERLFELAEQCLAGKCEEFAEKLAWLKTDEARCVVE